MPARRNAVNQSLPRRIDLKSLQQARVGHLLYRRLSHCALAESQALRMSDD